jgi:hypothetical protein
VLFPNILKIVYGRHATDISGILFSYIGVSSTAMLFLLRTPLGTEYIWFWGIGSCMSVFSFIILMTVFNQTKFSERRRFQRLKMAEQNDSVLQNPII